MFKFFKRNTPNIHSLLLPDLGWEADKQDKSIKQWIHPEHPIALSVNFFEQTPDLPSMSKIDVLRKFYRYQISQHNGGLVQVDFVDLKGYAAVKTLFKIPQQPNGMTYLGSLILPFADCSYVVKIQAAEMGMVGMRDTFLSNKFLSEGKISTGENGFEGWFQDPYDPSFAGGTLMNMGESEAYDERFPYHPLTQSRALMKRLETEIEFKEELGKLQPFQQ